jgi:hypothetical protein
MTDLSDIDHQNHWYILDETHPSSRDAILATVQERIERYQMVQIVHNHYPDLPCTKGCYSIP